MLAALWMKVLNHPNFQQARQIPARGPGFTNMSTVDLPIPKEYTQSIWQFHVISCNISNHHVKRSQPPNSAHDTTHPAPILSADGVQYRVEVHAEAQATPGRPSKALVVWKIWKSVWTAIPSIWKNKNVPNHQPDYFWWLSSLGHRRYGTINVFFQSFSDTVTMRWFRWSHVLPNG